MTNKNHFLLVCLLLTVSALLGGCRKKETNCTDLYPIEVAGTCDISTHGQDDLRREAMRLSLSYFRQFEITPADAFIPESVWMPVFSALVAVRAAIPQIECEDMSSLLEIDVRNTVSAEQMIVEVDTNHSWTAAWRNGDSQTGNPAIDSLMDKYQLSLLEYHDNSFTERAIIEAAEPLHIPQLSTEFSAIAGVLQAEPNYLVGDGDRIEVEYVGTDLLLKISKGYGDCPSGCINRDTWTFRVEEDCTVWYEAFESR